MKKDVAHYLLCALEQDAENLCVSLVRERQFETAIEHAKVGIRTEDLLGRVEEVSKPDLPKRLAATVKKFFESTPVSNGYGEQWFVEAFSAADGGPAYVERDYYHGAKERFDQKYKEEWGREPPDIPSKGDK